MKVIKEPLTGKTIKVHENIAGEVKAKKSIFTINGAFKKLINVSILRLLCDHLLR
jgi:hypothetical protein